MLTISERNGLFYPNSIKNVRYVTNNDLFSTTFCQNEPIFTVIFAHLDEIGQNWIQNWICC